MKLAINGTCMVSYCSYSVIKVPRCQQYNNAIRELNFNYSHRANKNSLARVYNPFNVSGDLITKLNYDTHYSISY